MRIALAILLLFGTSQVWSQDVFHYNQNISITQFENIDSGHLECIIPYSYAERQAIINYNLSIKPDTIVARDNNLIGRWDIHNFKLFSELSISANLIVQKFNWGISKNIPGLIISKEDLNLYLNLKFKNKEPYRELFEVASNLKSSSPEETLLNIYSFLKVRNKQLRSLTNLFPSKAKREILFVSLCRINNIPSRITQAINSDQNPSIIKYIIEVFINNHGWIPIDISNLKKDSSIKNKPSESLVYLSYDNPQKLYRWKLFGSKPNFKIETSYELTNNLDILYLEAFNLYNLNELGKSLTIFKRLHKRAPKDYDISTMIGAIHSRANQKILAQEYLSKAMQLARYDDERCTVNYAYANFHARQGNENLALSYLRKALEKCWFSYESVYNDIDLQKLKKNSKFIRLIDTLQKDIFFVAPN
ncbi:MAG: transglutaminase-like domain-containing protein [Bacteroidia bacterium]|nr:transglutaminase-like domain-containing protein [Bacteroidia bacterium]